MAGDRKNTQFSANNSPYLRRIIIGSDRRPETKGRMKMQVLKKSSTGGGKIKYGKTKYEWHGWTVVSIGPLQIGQWPPFTATSVSTHCLQNVACPHGTKAMFSRAATRRTSHVMGTEAAAGVTVAAAVTVTSLLPSSSVRSYSVLLPSSSWVKTFVTDSEQ